MKEWSVLMSPDKLCGVLDLYREAVPECFFQQLQQELHLPVRQRIFSLPLVIWLMISQRLDRKATLSTAVQQVVQQRPRTLLSDHKRLREGTVSCHTGAYSDARREMPLLVAEKVADCVLGHLMPSRREALPGWNRRVFHFGWHLVGDAAHYRTGEGVSTRPQITLARSAHAGGTRSDHRFGAAALLGAD